MFMHTSFYLVDVELFEGYTLEIIKRHKWKEYNIGILCL